jgi:hypothetical protein
MVNRYGRQPHTQRIHAGESVMSSPFHAIRPAVGAVIPAIIRRRVNLPAPFGPSKPSTSPSASQLTSETAVVSP